MTKIQSKSLLFLVVLTALTIWGCTEQKKIERPRDPWVFRSVLDDQPRMVTVALHEDMYLAFDARQAGIYKMWKGGVNFDGAVYTTVHGPQPTSNGYAYYNRKLDKPYWLLKKGDAQEQLAVDFKGYEIRENQVYFKYHLLDNAGNTIKVEENPEHIVRANQDGLKRSFVISDLPEGTKLGMISEISSLKNKGDFSTNGTFDQEKEEEQSYSKGKTISLLGTLWLNSNSTEVTTYFHPGFDSGTTTSTSQADDMVLSEYETLLSEGKDLIYNSDCKTCHNEQKKTVGPAYVKVAERYSTDEATIEELAGKVMKGGKGNWGEVPMNAHPDLQIDDAKKMVSYILSLDGEKPKDESYDPTLGIESIALTLSDNNENVIKEGEEDTQQAGLAANAYKMEGWDLDFEKLKQNVPPVMSGVIPAIHALKIEDIGNISTGVFITFEGNIAINETSNYVFRLVSDDGSKLWIDDKMILDNGGYHGFDAKDAEIYLTEGSHKIYIEYFQGGGGAGISFQWAKYGDNEFSIVPNTVLSHNKSAFKEVVKYIPRHKLVKSIPGDQTKLTDVHPAFDLSQARPDDFQPRVGGMDFLSDGRLVVCTWDSLGAVYVIDGVQTGDPTQMNAKMVASGLAEPLGLKVVDDEIYVLQKQELTKLIDHNGDEIIDEYQTLCDAWRVSSNFHEFSFGLVYEDGYFYAALAIAIMPGGASADPQIPDRGKAVKISKQDGSIEYYAHGLRTPNGIGIGVDGEIFIADNQGDWLPSSKILHVTKDAWFGSRAVDYEGTADLKEKLPVVWLPQDEIGNSPTTPLALDLGPYKGQMVHGEVTHGGVKRVFVEKVNGEYQGAVFRFIQGIEAGVNRLAWGPDNALYVGGVGSSGNWQQDGKLWYGLQRLSYNEKSVFEPLAIRAKSNGIEVEFTEPIALGAGQNKDDYEIKQWYYLPTKDYGGPKLDEKELNIRALNISEDRKKVFFELDGMEDNHVVHFRVSKPFTSTNNNSLWTTEGWYTMNSIPENLPGFVNPVQPLPINQLSEQEIADGWKLLFDGKSTDGWRKFKGDKAGTAWKVANGNLYLDNSQKDGWQVVGGGDIITEKSYDNYELKLEWKIEKGGNSGIIYNVVESDQYDYVWQTGPEMQVLDNLRHPDGRIEVHRSGDLYDLIESKFVTVNEAEEWNQVRLISNNGKVEHWLNGYKVVEYDMNESTWPEMIKNSKFNEMPDFGKSQQGHISLQDHGDKVWYRNIKIKEL